MYGKEYTILLTGDLPRSNKSQFYNTLKSVEGIKSVNLRKSDPGVTGYVVTYSGSEVLSELIFAKLDASASSDVFKSYEVATDGTTLKFFPGKK
jgi:hypothetical protein